jgi:hypothetical protein
MTSIKHADNSGSECMHLVTLGAGRSSPGAVPVQPASPPSLELHAFL